MAENNKIRLSDTSDQICEEEVEFSNEMTRLDQTVDVIEDIVAEYSDAPENN